MFEPWQLAAMDDAGYTHITDDMKRNASSVVGGFLTNILGEDLKPWQKDEKRAQEA